MEIGTIVKLTDKEIKKLKQNSSIDATHEKLIGFIDLGVFGISEQWEYLKL